MGRALLVELRVEHLVIKVGSGLRLKAPGTRPLRGVDLC